MQAIKEPATASRKQNAENARPADDFHEQDRSQGRQPGLVSPVPAAPQKSSSKSRDDPHGMLSAKQLEVRRERA
jgi:hypothetical protein